MKYVHLAWDRPEDDLESDFERFARLYKRKSPVYKEVYVLVNFNSTLDQDFHRIYTLRRLGFDPYIMIYDKEHAAHIYKRIARWVNCRPIRRNCPRFEDYRD